MTDLDTGIYHFDNLSAFTCQFSKAFIGVDYLLLYSTEEKCRQAEVPYGAIWRHQATTN